VAGPAPTSVRTTRTVPPGRSSAENPCNPAPDPRGSGAFLIKGGLLDCDRIIALALGKFKSGLARRLLVMLWAMLRTNQRFRDPKPNIVCTGIE